MLIIIFLMSIPAFAQQATSKNIANESKANISKEKLSANRSPESIKFKDGFKLNADKTISPIDPAKKKTLIAKPIEKKNTKVVSQPSNKVYPSDKTLMQSPQTN